MIRQIGLLAAFLTLKRDEDTKEERIFRLCSDTFLIIGRGAAFLEKIRLKKCSALMRYPQGLGIGLLPWDFVQEKKSKQRSSFPACSADIGYVSVPLSEAFPPF